MPRGRNASKPGIWSGLAATCSFTITVADDEPPVFADCPLDASFGTDPGLPTARVNWDPPTATDNCAGVYWEQTGGPLPDSDLPVGDYGITYTATDAAGHTAVCEFTVSVVDDQPPMIEGCPSNITQSTDPGLCTAVVSWREPTVSDNVPGAIIIQTGGLPPGSAFPVGTSVITYLAEDLSGNTATCSFNVTVTDDQAPAFGNCPTNITVNAEPGECSAVVTWTAPTASDNCGEPVVTSDHNPGDRFQVDTPTSVIYTGRDPNGLSATCSFTVTVVDREPPVLSNCPPSPMVLEADAWDWAPIPDLTAQVSADDNCDSVNVAQAPSAGTQVGLGSHTVTLTAADAAGNNSICQVTITVEPRQARPCTGVIESNFNGTGIPAGRYIWFNSIVKPSEVPGMIVFSNVAIRFSAGGLDYIIPVPDSVITYSSGVSLATTSFDASTNTWHTTVPVGYTGNVFLSGVPFAVASDLPGGINPVTWSGDFESDTAGLHLQWKWAAAVYTVFSSDPDQLGVKPVDGSQASIYDNSDHAGTPEQFKPHVVGGARGGGGSNYTGGYSGTASVTACPAE